MARATGTRAAAIRRRRKHEQRIGEQANPLDQARLTWAWIFAEMRRHPHQSHRVVERLHAIGADLNDLEAQPAKEEAQ